MAETEPAPAVAQTDDREFLKYLYQGGDFLSANNLPAAREILEKAFALQPSNPKAQNLLGLACFKSSAFERAGEVYQLLVNSNPTDPTLRVNLGLVYLKQNKLPQAISEFEAAVGLAPGHKKAQSYLGLAYAQTGDYARARVQFVAAGNTAMAEKMDQSLGGAAGANPSAAPAFEAAAAVSSTNRSEPPTTASAQNTPTVATPISPDKKDTASSSITDSSQGLARVIVKEDVGQTVHQSDQTVSGLDKARNAEKKGEGEKNEADTEELSVDIDADSDSSIVEPATDRALNAGTDTSTGASTDGPSTGNSSSAGASAVAASPNPTATIPPPLAASAPSPSVSPAADPSASSPPVTSALAPSVSSKPASSISSPPASSASSLPDTSISSAPVSSASALDAGAPSSPEIASSDAKAGSVPIAKLGCIATFASSPAGPFEITRHKIALHVRGELWTRLEGLLAAAGSLSYVPEMKRFHGRATDKAFGEGEHRMVRAIGNGTLFLSPKNQVFTPIELTEESAYFREDAVFAFEQSAVFENGRVPSRFASDLHLMHVRGQAKLLLSTSAALRTLTITRQMPGTIPLATLVGWHGALTPRMVGLPEEQGGSTPIPAVELVGEGFAILAGI